MTESEIAISLFEKQKEKIKFFPNSNDEFWRIATLQLIEKYIGKGTPQYDLIAGHTFYPNKGTTETEQSQRERGEMMIDSCIMFIEAHGVKSVTPVTPQTIIINDYSVKGDNNIHSSSLDETIFSPIKSPTKTPAKNNKAISKTFWWLLTIVGAIVSGLIVEWLKSKK